MAIPRWLVQRGRWVRNRIRDLSGPPKLVLLYHRVTELPDDREQLAVSPANFRAHIEYLCEYFPVQRFERCHESWDATSVAITFDDGYADNCLEALPILEEFDCPATFFVATDNIDTTREFWWDDLARCLFEGKQDETFTMEVGGTAIDLHLVDRAATYARVSHTLHHSPPGEIAEFMDELRSRTGIPDEGRPGYRAMSMKELKQLAQSPVVTLGAHTLSHARLASLTEQDQRNEIEQSLYRLREWTGQDVPVFSFPFGDSVDYNEASVDICKSLGFAAVAANNNRAYRSFHSKYEIPRLLVRNWDIDEFARKLGEFRAFF